jgi:propionyl-CoA carboxylase alpha chain
VARFAVALTADEVTVDGTALDLCHGIYPRRPPGRGRGRWRGAERQGCTHAQRLRADHARAIHKVQVLPAHVAPYAKHMIEKIPPDLSRFLICPMPGLLVALHVGEGDAVEAGQPLAVVEAMKMENILRAQKAAG